MPCAMKREGLLALFFFIFGWCAFPESMNGCIVFLVACTSKLCFAHAADFKQVTLRVGDIKVTDAERIGDGCSSREAYT